MQNSDNLGKSNTKEREMKTNNRIGRVKNAVGSSLKFVPHTVLQLEPIKKEEHGKLIYAINQGHIGSFEIEILDWVNKLKYSTKAMMMDLILSGYISLGKREKISPDKLSAIFERLYRYDLVDLTRMIAVTDEGKIIDEKRKSIMRVNTIGKTGHDLLKEIGRRPQRRDMFTVLADGNTVKKCLSANQWIVYWLTHFTNEQIVDYSIVQMINQIGTEWNAARIYATVNMEKKAMIAEPIRRCEEFELEAEDEMMRGKFMRFVMMFDNMDKLYTGTREPIVYTSRPVITYLCEDDEHINEVINNLRALFEEHPEQEVWFATDQRTFNYDKRGKRFMRLEGNRLVYVNLKEELGVDEISMEERGKKV